MKFSGTDVAPETVEALGFTWESIPAGQKFTSATLEGLTEFLDMRAEIDHLHSLLLKAEEERDEAQASLVQLRSAWNAHFARCSTPLVEGMTDAEFFKRLDEWREVLGLNAAFDFHATQHIDGLEHDGHALRVIHIEDVDAILAPEETKEAGKA